MSTDDFMSEIKNQIYKELVESFKKDVEEIYAKRIQRATLTTEQAAEYIGVCKETLLTLVKEGRVPAVQINSINAKRPNYRFRLTTLDKFMENDELRMKGDVA